MTDIQLFLVGGFVRDHLLGVESKDVDFVAVADSFEAMEEWLTDNGFEIFLSTPEYFTIRARGPKGFTFAGHEFGNMTFDFVWAREDGPYSDGRRPDFVKPGSLLTDLQRRDFTINALAMDADGNIIDPFDGARDLDNRILRAVGNANDRFAEDALRIVRAVRLALTKNLTIEEDTRRAMIRNVDGLDDTAAERIREELTKMFRFDSIHAVTLIVMDFPVLLSIMRHHNINLKPTLEKM
jgi:tRNA nucleotidyltransferase (CCA-adding enzyme)